MNFFNKIKKQKEDKITERLKASIMDIQAVIYKFNLNVFETMDVFISLQSGLNHNIAEKLNAYANNEIILRRKLEEYNVVKQDDKSE